MQNIYSHVLHRKHQNKDLLRDLYLKEKKKK